MKGLFSLKFCLHILEVLVVFFKRVVFTVQIVDFLDEFDFLFLVLGLERVDGDIAVLFGLGNLFDFLLQLDSLVVLLLDFSL